jgi:hypothetical protein
MLEDMFRSSGELLKGDFKIHGDEGLSALAAAANQTEEGAGDGERLAKRPKNEKLKR